MEIATLEKLSSNTKLAPNLFLTINPPYYAYTTTTLQASAICFIIVILGLILSYKQLKCRMLKTFFERI